VQTSASCLFVTNEVPALKNGLPLFPLTCEIIISGALSLILHSWGSASTSHFGYLSRNLVRADLLCFGKNAFLTLFFVILAKGLCFCYPKESDAGTPTTLRPLEIPPSFLNLDLMVDFEFSPKLEEPPPLLVKLSLTGEGLALFLNEILLTAFPYNSPFLVSTTMIPND